MTTSFNSRVSHDFSKAAHTYDTHAALQRKVAENLFALLGKPQGLTLDIGCGTGYFHELLRKNKIYEPLVQMDIAMAMCQLAASYGSPPEYGATHTCAADMHKLPFADGSFANIFSSMTIQWAEDMAQVFAEIRRTLTDDGKFALSIVAEGSLHELQTSFVQAGYAPPIHKFENEAFISQQLQKAGFSKYDISCETITLYYPDIFAIIAAIKGIGARYKGSREGGMKGKGYFIKIQEVYKQQFGNEKGLPLSWNIIYVTGNK